MEYSFEHSVKYWYWVQQEWVYQNDDVDDGHFDDGLEEKFYERK